MGESPEEKIQSEEKSEKSSIKSVVYSAFRYPIPAFFGSVFLARVIHVRYCAVFERYFASGLFVLLAACDHHAFAIGTFSSKLLATFAKIQ